MNRVFYVVTLVLLAAAEGCSVLKEKYMAKTDSSSVRQSALNISESLSASGSTQRLLVVSDSSDHRYSAEIIPSGAFHYSPEEGFTGVASRIVIRGRLKAEATGRDAITSSGALKVETDSSLQEREQSSRSGIQKEVRKEKSGGRSGVLWWSMLVLCLAAAGAMYVFRKKLFRNFSTA